MPIIWELAEKVGPEHGITLRNMRKRDATAEMQRFAKIFNEAWKNNWGYVPYSERDIKELALDLRLFFFSNWTWIAENSEGETVAAAISVPDLNQVLAHMNGRILPFGWVTLAAAQEAHRPREGGLARRPARVPAHRCGRGSLRRPFRQPPLPARPGARRAGSSRPTRA